MSRSTSPNRLKGTFNALTAAAALFCAVFVLLSVQMVIGHDPAIGAGRSSTTKAKSKKAYKPRKNEGTSWQALVNRAADSVDSQPAPSEPTYTTPQQSYATPQQTYTPPQQTYSAPPQYVAPAPVQSSVS